MRERRRAASAPRDTSTQLPDRVARSAPLGNKSTQGRPRAAPARVDTITRQPATFAELAVLGRSRMVRLLAVSLALPDTIQFREESVNPVHPVELRTHRGRVATFCAHRGCIDLRRGQSVLAVKPGRSLMQKLLAALHAPLATIAQGSVGRAWPALLVTVPRQTARIATGAPPASTRQQQEAPAQVALFSWRPIVTELDALLDG